jgi:hypothetical protein
MFIGRAEVAEGSEDIFVRWCTHAGYSCRSPVIYCDVCASLVHLSRRNTEHILEARALLKIFFAVAHAVFISQSNLAFPSVHFRTARKRVDIPGSAVVSFSRLWNCFRCA